ncbi:acetyl-CoA synthetase-like protein [Gymnopus androsaceus JB14]|uniref:Acetyl-CoA synthetase-like protein n=1 Tax=Gymnopus androsaceus JB14 TaxID=1447944 RepID=A0A6A4IF94_9AGAR|nr:acetyl-CoA synthetase-like protein [Gymnopus androsaceus JB14]
MYLKSLFPDIPPLQDVNVHNVFFNRPDQSQWPEVNIHIDIETDRKRTFKELKERVNDAYTAFSSALKDGGMDFGSEGTEEMVGIMSENSSDYMVLIHALMANTTPFALISSYSTRFELLHAFRLSKITRLFVQPKYLSHAISVAREVGLSLTNIYIIGGHVKGHQSLSGMIERARSVPRVPAKPAKQSTLAYLVFSSGTSGLPKAVMITHGNILFSIHQSIVAGQAVAEVVPPSEEIPVSLAFLPLHHSYGLHAYCFRSLLSPHSYVIMPKWNINAALKAIPKYRISNLALIPSVFHQLVNHPQISSVDLSSVKHVGSGAAYLPQQLVAKMKTFTPKDSTITEGYGMSECTIAALTQVLDGMLGGRGKLLPGSTGVLLPGMEARIVRDDGSEANFNEVGELWLRSPNVSPGYWNNEKANKETFVDGWLRTGDKFSVNEEGYFFFADRAKDTLKVSGSQVSPLEIEEVLLAHPEKLITDVTVAGVSGGRTSDEKVPRAWIVLSAAGKKKGAAAVIKKLDEWQKENLSKYKWTRGGIEVVKEIPKSPTGKTLRRVLVDKYERKFKKSQSKL